MNESLSELWDVLSRNALRTLLTGLSVAWGMFMLVVLLGAGQGLENGAAWEFRDDAQNSLTVSPGKTSLPYQGRGPGREVRLFNRDQALLPREIPAIDHISGRFYMWGEYSVSYGTKSASFDVRGVHPDHVYLEKTLLKRGRFINQLDLLEQRKVAVIGRRVSEMLLGRRDPIGEQLNIKGLSYKVVGEFVDEGGEAELLKIYVPITTAQLVYSQPGRVHQLLLTMGDASVDESRAIATQVRQLLGSRHGFAPEDKRALRIMNSLEQYQRVTAVFSWLHVFVWVVGAGTLLAGIIGIGNIMLISVAERTQEIGIRKALGATPGSIIRMVLAEALVLTGVSGYAGLTAGVVLIEIVARNVQDVPFLRNPSVNIGASLVAAASIMVAGALAGFFPAWRAARINPIEALRAE